MKRIVLFFSSLLCLISFSVNAANIRAVSNGGNWTSPSTWNLDRVPGNGDVVIIPHNITVNVTSNVYNSVPSRPVLEIEVSGVLRLTTGSGQLNLACGSKVCVINCGNIPRSGCNCNQIAIGLGEAVWKGAAESLSGGDCLRGPEGCDGSLPLDLISFEGYAEGQAVVLNWETVNEVNVRAIIVERSSDGINYKTLTSIDAEEGKYSYEDKNPLPGNNYYRLKEVDIDNSFSYSPSVSVNYSSANRLTVAPNPVTGGNITITLFNETGVSDVYLVDIVGNQMPVSFYSLNGYSYSLSYSSSLTSGVYFVKVVTAGEILTQRIEIL